MLNWEETRGDYYRDYLRWRRVAHPHNRIYKNFEEYLKAIMDSGDYRAKYVYDKLQQLKKASDYGGAAGAFLSGVATYANTYSGALGRNYYDIYGDTGAKRPKPNDKIGDKNFTPWGPQLNGAGISGTSETANGKVAGMVRVHEADGDQKQVRKKHKIPKAPLSRLEKVEGKLKKLKGALPKFAKFVHYTNYAHCPVSALNQCLFTDRVLLNNVDLEAIFLARVPVLDTTTPANGKQLDLTTVVYNQTFVVSTFFEIRYRNNGTFACDVDFYIVTPKEATSNDPITVLHTAANWTKNQPAGGTTIVSTASGSSPHLKPSMNEMWVRDWDIMETKSFRLNPGSEFVEYHSWKFKYNQEEKDDTTNLTNIPGQSRWILLRTRGTICHDSTTTTNVGYSNTQLDGIIQRKIDITYEAGAPFRTYDYTQSINTVTTAVQSIHDLN